MMADFAVPLDLPELVLGGGLGVRLRRGRGSADDHRSGATCCSTPARRSACAADVSVEPGRAIVADAAITVYTVGTIKHIPGVRTYVAVDGGMSDNPRPVLYGSGYEAFLPARRRAPSGRMHARLVGKHCESGDVLIFDALLPERPTVGDLVATPVTGAYGRCMASNYNMLTRPPVVFVGDGAARAVVRRETMEDLVRCDLD